MTRRALAVAAAALSLAAGCNKGSSGPAFRLSEPSSVALFHGYAHARTTADGVDLFWPYVAVANSALDEVIFFDPVDDKVAPAPIVIRPLSIPLPSPRPALLASAAFTPPCANPTDDPTTCSRAATRPDLLAVVAAGSTELQLIRTWKSSVDAQGIPVALDPGLVPEPPIELGDEVVALVATPSVDSTFATTGLPVPDRVRVVAALADGRLAIVEYQWSGDPTVGEVLPTADDATGQNRVTAVNTTPDYQSPGFVSPGSGGQPGPIVPALSLAVDPSLDANHNLRNPTKLYAATLGSIGPSSTQGVAEFDMTGTAGAWTMRALDAHTPTRLVAAFTLWERQLGVAGAYDQITRPVGPTTDSTGTSFPGNGDRSAFQVADANGNDLPPKSRVYAYRDPSSCGPKSKTGELCGIAILDPETGDVLEDQWHQGVTPKQYMPPIPLQSIPVAMVPGTPAWNPPTDENIPDEIDNGGDAAAANKHRFMLLTTGTGIRLTTGVLFIPCQNGRSYFADLARWEIPSNTWEISLVGSFCTVSAYRASETDRPQIGFYEPKDLADADVANASGNTRNLLEPSTAATSYFKLTPGFTPDDIWNITYQGHLPDFAANRPAVVQDDGGTLPAGQLRVAFQVPNPDPSQPPSQQIVSVFDPALGVRVGDIVEFWTAGYPVDPTSDPRKPHPICPDTTTTDATGQGVQPIEGKIVEVTRPDVGHPGGSLVVQKGDCVPVKATLGTACDADTHGPWNSTPNCWLDGTTNKSQLLGLRQVRIRAGGGGVAPDATNADGTFVLDGRDFVVTGTGTGYAGRATSRSLQDVQNAPVPTPDFQLSNADEALACPAGIIPYQYPANPDPTAVPDCDETCRRACENAAVARRARRTHLPSVYCFKASTESTRARNFCETHFPDFAIQAKQDGTAPSGTFDQAVGNHVPGEPPSGPALGFTLGVKPAATANLLLVRDTQVVLATRSGYQPVNRFGGGANSGPSTGPTGAAYFDRSFDLTWAKQADRYRFFVPHVGNVILDASPAHNNGDTRVLR